ncbi:MAG: 50S ribosomal protein L29 [Candidatus Competibacteraceae bacterium]|nr:50S ribosomal protein L29 [Candidatus Competibacteraceae bacterium]
MKSSEIKELSHTELDEKLDLLREQLSKQKLNHVVSPLENPLMIRKNRKDIARLLTEKKKRSSAQ